MSTKTFCDVCGAEVEDDATLAPTQVDKTFRNNLPSVTVTVRITVVMGGDVENLCHECLFDVIEAGDPRPKLVLDA